jgi:hypothetical protein
MSVYRFRIPSFRKMLWTCSLTVPWLSPSWASDFFIGQAPSDEKRDLAFARD